MHSLHFHLILYSGYKMQDAGCKRSRFDGMGNWEPEVPFAIISLEAKSE